jgi:hypothetical protein
LHAKITYLHAFISSDPHGELTFIDSLST